MDTTHRDGRPPPPPTPAAARGWAQVCADHRVVRYWRAGTGRPVLIVGDRLLDRALLEALARRFRLLAPVVDGPPAADLVACLRCFLEGLGTTEIAVVVAEPFARAALDLAALGGAPVTRVAIVKGAEVSPETPTEPDGGVPLLGARPPSEEVPVPILAVDPGAVSPAAHDRLIDFLNGDPPGLRTP